jgi:hypothetical protein
LQKQQQQQQQQKGTSASHSICIVARRARQDPSFSTSSLPLALKRIMSRSFFAPDSKTPASPSDPARTPFLSNGNGSSEPYKEEPLVLADASSKATLTSLAPILSYCGASITMTVVNKVSLIVVLAS